MQGISSLYGELLAAAKQLGFIELVDSVRFMLPIFQTTPKALHSMHGSYFGIFLFNNDNNNSNNNFEQTQNKFYTIVKI
jgi:hypothetical protein